MNLRSTTCLHQQLALSENIGHIVEQDRNMFANKILNVLHKDENFVQGYELRMTVYIVSPFVKAFQKFTGQKSFETLKILLSKEGTFVMDTSFASSIELLLYILLL